MANNYKNAKVDLTTTDVTTLYTAASAVTRQITNTSVDRDVFSIYKNEEVGALSTKELLTQPLVVQETEILKITAATANRLHVVASYLEIS